MTNSNKYLLSTFLFIGVSFATLSCSQQETMLYEQNAGVVFAPQQNLEFSFFNYPGQTEHICEFETRISGNAVDRERKINVILAEDDEKQITTATNEQYELLGGVVPAGAYKGKIYVKVKATDNMEAEVFYAYFKILPNEDFPIAGFDNVKLKLGMTKLILKPRYWGNWTYKLGTPFSSNWYRFILDAMKVDYIPYPAANEGDRKWTWQEFEANASRVKAALIKYNNEHPDDKLKHLDGDFAGDEISMP